jgi:hypothetical protein
MPGHSLAEIAARRLIYVKLLSAQTRSHISTTAQTNERTIPSEVLVIGHSRASRRNLSGTEDALMTPHRVLFRLWAQSSRRFNPQAVTRVTANLRCASKR